MRDVVVRTNDDGAVGSLYEHDPGMKPDSEFELGRLRHLMLGNDGRLLDARRTPVRVVGLRPELAFFEVEVLAFEDRGARWELPMDAVDRFQFTMVQARSVRPNQPERADRTGRNGTGGVKTTERPVPDR